MTINQLIEKSDFQLINKGINLNRKISKPFCCDLLSIAMSRASEGCAWVTVMGNVNTIAIVSLTDTACLILAEGADLDETAKLKAVSEGITVLRTTKPIFETATIIAEMIND